MAPSTKVLRVGIIGAGANTRSRHIPGFQAIDGVEVVDVQPESKAWAAGLRPGDVVTEVNRDAISDPDQFVDAIDDADGRVLLHVLRVPRGPGAPPPPPGPPVAEATMRRTPVPSLRRQRP